MKGWRGSPLVPRELESKPLLFVTDGVPIGVSRERKRYLPLNHPELFRVFSSLEPSDTEILNFANRYGLLAEDSVFGTDEPTLGFVGLSLDFCKQQIAVMNEAVTLWTQQKKNDPKLAKVIRWRKDAVVYSGRFRGITLVDGDRHPHWLKRWKRGETKGPALMALQHIINDYIFQHVGSRLLWNESGTAMDAYFVPRNLMGAMWLQFARALIWPKKHRPCEVCGRVMEISTDPHSQVRKRADTSVCGDKCRSQKRRDKEKSIGLRLDGYSLNRIRRKVAGNYPLETLKKWTSGG